MGFLDLFKAVEKPVKTEAYKNFGEYVSDQPLPVYYGENQLGTIPKIVAFESDELETRYDISYSTAKLNELLEDYGVLNTPQTRVFNGSDLVIYPGKVPASPKVKVPLDMVVNIAGTDITLYASFDVVVIETNSSIIRYEFRHQDLLNKVIDKYGQQYPVFDYINKGDYKALFADNKFTIVIEPPKTRLKTVKLDGNEIGVIEIGLELLDTFDMSDVSIDVQDVMDAFKDVINQLEFKHRKVKEINLDCYGILDKHPHINIVSEFDYETIDPVLLEVTSLFYDYIKDQTKNFKISKTTKIHETFLQEFLIRNNYRFTGETVEELLKDEEPLEYNSDKSAIEQMDKELEKFDNVKNQENDIVAEDIEIAKFRDVETTPDEDVEDDVKG